MFIAAVSHILRLCTSSEMFDTYSRCSVGGRVSGKDAGMFYRLVKKLVERVRNYQYL